MNRYTFIGLFVAIGAIIFWSMGYVGKNQLTSVSSNTTTQEALEQAGLSPSVPKPAPTEADNLSSENVDTQGTASEDEIVAVDAQDSQTLTEEQIAEAIEWSNNPEHLEHALRADGISDEGVEAVMSKDSFALISVDDLPDDMKELTLSLLAEEQERGFGKATDFEMNEIVDVLHFIVGDDVEGANITMKALVLPSNLEETHQYIGYTHPNYSVNTDVAQMQNDTLRRVYSTHTDGNVLIIQESRHTDGAGATMIRESINTTVGGKPARFSIKKSEDGRSYAVLNWTNENKSFVLYETGNLEDAEAELIRIGNLIDPAQGN